MKTGVILLGLLAVASLHSAMAAGLQKEILKKGDCSVKAASGDQVKVRLYIMECRRQRTLLVDWHFSA